MELNTLKPCPFCGGEARVALRGDRRLMIGCEDGCECSVTVGVPCNGGFFDWINLGDLLQAYEEAAAKWNRRANDGEL